MHGEEEEAQHSREKDALSDTEDEEDIPNSPLPKPVQDWLKPISGSEEEVYPQRFKLVAEAESDTESEGDPAEPPVSDSDTEGVGSYDVINSTSADADELNNAMTSSSPQVIR